MSLALQPACSLFRALQFLSAMCECCWLVRPAVLARVPCCAVLCPVSCVSRPTPHQRPPLPHRQGRQRDSERAVL